MQANVGSTSAIAPSPAWLTQQCTPLSTQDLPWSGVQCKWDCPEDECKSKIKVCH